MYYLYSKTKNKKESLVEKVIENLMPKEMLELKQWCVWKLEKNIKGGSKLAKRSYFATTDKYRWGRQGSAEDRANLVTYEEASFAAAMGDYDGIGFCVLPGDGIVAVDIDGCASKDSAGNTVFDENATNIMAGLPGYWEMSPSGNGVHGFFTGVARSRNWGHCETYHLTQFLTWTGDVIQECNKLMPYVDIPGTDPYVKKEKAVDDNWFPYSTDSHYWAEAKRALDIIDPDLTYSDWIMVAQALNNGFGDEGLALFKEWSERGVKSSEGAAEAKWEEFSPTGGVGLASLFYIGKEHGFTPSEERHEEWKDQLLKDKDDKYVKCDYNLEVIVDMDPKLPRFKQNDLTDSFDMIGPTPWPGGVRKRERGELVSTPNSSDMLMVRNYVRDKYGVSFPIQTVDNSIVITSIKRRFHPVLEYLDSLEGAWDGTPRVDTWMHDYLGVKDDEYHREVGKLMLDGAVCRMKYPGCKFDYAVVIEGKQGARKSTLVKTLAKEFFSDDEISMDDKDTLIAIKGNWFVELGEMGFMKKSEVNKVKAFMSRSTDKFRAPFERRTETHPRSCVFVGTTNQDTYLKDNTGNRRFIPVKCELATIDIDKLKSNVDQIWAEVLHKIQPGREYNLNLKGVASATAEAEQSTRVEEDESTSTVKELIFKLVHKEHLSSTQPDLLDGECDTQREYIFTKEVWEKVFARDSSDTWSRMDQRRVNEVLNTIPYLGPRKQMRSVAFGSSNCRKILWDKVPQEDLEMYAQQKES